MSANAGRLRAASRARFRGLGVALVALALALPALATVTDDVQTLGFDPEQLRVSMFGALRGFYALPDVKPAVRALPAEQKVAAVQTLGAFAKATFASAEFKKRYVSKWKEGKPRGLHMPSVSMKGLAKAAVEKAKSEEKTQEKAADLYALDKDPNMQLKRALEAYLAATEDVDYDAATHGEGGMRRFDKAEYENKPPAWKLSFRAGKDAGEAIRAFARDWLAELK